MERPFYEREPAIVARESIGKILVHGKTAGRIVETEAYLGRDDRAAHAWRGETKRTRVLFGPAGHAYVYLIYGMYWCLNFVCEPPGSAGCVLIRAVEPLCGIRVMAERRGEVKRVQDLASGPGKLTVALGITLECNAADLVRGPLRVRQSKDAGELEIAITPRIGIRHNADWPLRFVLAGSRYASGPRLT